MFAFLSRTRRGEVAVVHSAVPSAALSGAQGDQEPLPRRGLVFFVVSIALFMASIDQTIVATALSTIEKDLHGGIEWSSWTISIYALGQIVVMPLAGKLSDMLGRKRVFIVAVVVFTTASFCCGIATNIYLLVALRGVQALGGGALMPSATGIVADHFGRNRDRALGMFSSIFPIGAIVGPILGGIFVTDWSWRAIFLVNVPIGLVLLVLAFWILPKNVSSPWVRLDFVGIAELGVFLLSAMFGISFLGSGAPILSPGFLVPEAIAVVALILFIRHTKYAAAPFIPMKLLRGQGFGVVNLINFLYGAVALGFGALIPLYAQDHFGVPVLESGTLLTARAIGTVCVAGLGTLALRRTGYRIPMGVGFFIMALGLVATAIPPGNIPPYLSLSISGAITGIGMGLCLPAANNATMQLAREHLAGVAGLRGMFRQSGAIMSVSITSAFLARSHDPGETLAIVLIVFACVLVCTLPLVLLVPEHRGRW